MCSAWAFTQDQYFVTVVKGGSATKKDGTPVTVGTKLALADKVTFTSKDGLLILLHPSKGRVVVSAANAEPNKQNSFTLQVKDFLQINSKQVRASAGATYEQTVGLASYFKTNPAINNRILVIDTLQIPLPQNMFAKPDDNRSYFFLHLLANEPVRHKLMMQNNYLYITKQDIVFNDKLYSRDAGELKLRLVDLNGAYNKMLMDIVSFEPVFITREECAALIKSVMSVMKATDEYWLLNEVYMQLYYTYGKPSEKKIKEIYRSLQ
jgi:hypothetical protein